jgi:S1-C subfamily serine protease
MTEGSARPNFVWICPACGRKVPSRLTVCRCGSHRGSDGAQRASDGPQRESDGSDAAWPPADAPPAPPSGVGSKAAFHWLVLMGVAGIAIGLLIAVQVLPAKRASEHSPKSTSAAATPPQTVPPNPAGTAPLADSPVASDGPPRDASIPGSFPFPETRPPVPDTPPRPIESPSLEDVVSRAVPAIVSIETREGRGSGFFVTPQTIVTNRHVVGDNTSVMVRLASGAALLGRVETTSPEFDLAVVRVDSGSPSQPVLRLGSVNSVRAGQEVIAIGLALGVFQNTVTRGIVSAIRRAGPVVLVQTDAAINPGNSGGPLLDRDGQVIGINALKIAGSAESLGFAIAIDHAKSLLSGGRPADANFNSAPQASESLAPAFASHSSTDDMRAAGVKTFDRSVQLAAKRAAELDDYWSRIKATCPVRVAPGYDREWFGLWDGRAELTSADRSCGSAVKDLNELAGEVRTVMGKAQEDARHASVLPGQLRDIRHRYRMDWAGFDK